MSVVCFGEALIDFLSDGKAPESFTKYAGGAPANVAVALAKQGVPASFCGMLGQDMFGDFLKQELSSHGVNTQYCTTTDKAKTALAFVSLDDEGERSFSFYRPPAADLLFRIDDFDLNLFSEHNIIHVCSNSLTETNIYKSTIFALNEAKKHNVITSFDMNLRLNLWPSLNHTIERLWHIISLSDVVKLAKEELVFLNQHSHPSQDEATTINAILKAHVKCLIITDGAKDIHFYTSESKGVITPPNVTAIDTTAAGDAFVGGFLSQLCVQDNIKAELISSTFIERAIRYASYCGAHAVTKRGSFSSLPSNDDIVIS